MPEESILVGKTLSALGRELEVSFLVCAVVRDGTVHIPSGGFVLRAGDHIHITAAASEMEVFPETKNLEATGAEDNAYRRE